MFLRLTSSSLALAVFAAPAFALTPEEVWTAWTTYYGSMGYAVTEGSRDLAGETLTLKDVTFRMVSPEATVAIAVPQILMQGTGDGGVRSTMPDPLAITLDMVNPEDSKKVVVTATVAAPALEVVSTGDPASRTDRSTAPSMTISIDKVDLPDDPDLEKVATFTLTDLKDETTFTGNGTGLTSKGSVAKVDYTAAVDSGAEGKFSASGTVEGLASEGELSLPEGTRLSDAAALSAALRGGASFAGTIRFGANSHKFDMAGKDESGAETTGSGTTAAAGGEVALRLGGDGIAYKGAATGIDATMTVSELPMPVAYKLADASFELAMPVLKSDAPLPFKFGYNLGNLELGEPIWALFDAGAKLPRTPANLALDVTGTMTLAQDLFDPAIMKAETEGMEGMSGMSGMSGMDGAAGMDGMSGMSGMDGMSGMSGTTTEAPEGMEGAEGMEGMEGMEGGEAASDADSADAGDAAADAPMPFDVKEVTINKMLFEAVGAKASATGALKAPAGGSIDEPVGTISARLEGVNGLLDNLAAIGLIPEDQLQGVRMMLAVFSKPVEGDTNAMTSEIEFREGGQIFANGQQIQ